MTGPRRFSRGWWVTILAVAVAVCGTALLAFLGRGLDPGKLFLYCLVLAFAGDVLAALAMEAVAPTRVVIGPGDRPLKDDPLAELGVVVSEFDAAGAGLVRVRGETWRARSISREFTPPVGVRVRIVDRDGLTLIVSQP